MASWETLADNDQTVRQFNQSLADVSTMLAGEREELVAATQNLSVALTSVKEFVEENKGSLSRNITGSTGSPRCWWAALRPSTRSSTWHPVRSTTSR